MSSVTIIVGQDQRPCADILMGEMGALGWASGFGVPFQAGGYFRHLEQ